MAPAIKPDLAVLVAILLFMAGCTHAKQPLSPELEQDIGEQVKRLSEENDSRRVVGKMLEEEGTSRIVDEGSVGLEG